MSAADQNEGKIQLLLVNEIRLMGNIIAAAMEDEDDIQIAGIATNAEETLRALQNQHVDVALVSTRLPNQEALQLTKTIAEVSPGTKVLALGLTEDKSRVLRYIEAGASGYILKDDLLENMIDTVRAVQDGKVLVSPRMTAALVERLTDLAHLFSDIENSVTDDAGLTEREMDVLELIAKDMTNRQIADQLFIEIGTVKNHVHAILEKLNVSSRGDAAAYLAFIKKE